MMKYDRETDTLINPYTPKQYSPVLIKQGDFIMWDCEVLHKIKNAHKYINADLLEEMTKDNDYYVRVDITLLNPEDLYIPSIIKPQLRYDYAVSVYKKVINMIPTLDFEEVNNDMP